MWAAKELYQDFNRWALVNEYGYVASCRDATGQWSDERFANEHDAQRRAKQLNDLLPDPLPVMDKLLVSDELSERAAAVLSVVGVPTHGDRVDARWLGQIARTIGDGAADDVDRHLLPCASCGLATFSDTGELAVCRECEAAGG